MTPSLLNPTKDIQLVGSGLEDLPFPTFLQTSNQQVFGVRSLDDVNRLDQNENVIAEQEKEGYSANEDGKGDCRICGKSKDDTDNEDETSAELREKDKETIHRILGTSPKLAEGRQTWLLYQKRKWKIQLEIKQHRAEEKKGKKATAEKGSGLYEDGLKQKEYFQNNIKLIKTAGGKVWKCQKHKCQFAVIEEEENKAKRHVEQHRINRKHGMRNKKRTFSCPNCELFFTNKQLENKHYREVHQHTEYSCDMCEKKCKTKILLKYHMMVHDKKIECKVCQTMLTSERALSKHMVRFHTEKKIPETFGEKLEAAIKAKDGAKVRI